MNWLIILMIAIGAFAGFGKEEIEKRLGLVGGNGHDLGGAGRALENVGNGLGEGDEAKRLCPKCFDFPGSNENDSEKRPLLHLDGTFSTISEFH